jgi:hypothetical protein
VFYQQDGGWDVPARCKGKVVFSKLKKNLHTEDLQKELQHREDMPAVPKTNFTILKRQLIENEKRLLRERNPNADETKIKVMAKVFTPQCPDALFTIE